LGKISKKSPQLKEKTFFWKPLGQGTFNLKKAQMDLPRVGPKEIPQGHTQFGFKTLGGQKTPQILPGNTLGLEGLGP